MKDKHLRRLLIAALGLFWILCISIVVCNAGDTVIVNNGEVVISAGNDINGGVRVNNSGKGYRERPRYYQEPSKPWRDTSIHYHKDGSTSVRIGGAWIHHGLDY